MRCLPALAALAVTLAPVAALAAEGGQYTCAPNPPGSSVLTCVPSAPSEYAPPAQAPVAPPPPPPGYYFPPTDRTLAGRTHNWLVPTGELVPAGEAEIALHQFVYAAGAVGLTDNLELDFSTPIVPIFASVGARLGLTPRSSALRLVIGGDVWLPVMEDGDQKVFSGTLTVAYQTERLNLHGSMTYAAATDNDDAIGITAIGGTFKIAHKVALMGELVQLLAGDAAQADRFYLSAIGLKFMGADTDVDLGFVFPHGDGTGSYDAGHDGPGAMPMISMTYRF